MKYVILIPIYNDRESLKLLVENINSQIKDASEEDKKIKEIFTGILCCNKKLLEEAISEVNNDNAASEFY